MGIFALIQTVLTILAEFLRWKAAETQISARKLVYDTEQSEAAKIAAIRKQINSATDAGSLAASKLLVDTEANAALYLSDIRSAIPDTARASTSANNPGDLHATGPGNVRPGIGVPTATKPGA